MSKSPAVDPANKQFTIILRFNCQRSVLQAVQYSIAQHSIAQHSIAWHSIARHSIAHCRVNYITRSSYSLMQSFAVPKTNSAVLCYAGNRMGKQIN